MKPSKAVSLRKAAESGRLNIYLNRYLEECRTAQPGDARKPGGRFPNLAGFCRWLGCGISEIEALKLSHPDAADHLAAVMEDEALNSTAPLSPTVINAYLKRRLGYADKAEAAAQAECGDLQVIFEHDITEDGA